MNRPVIVIHAGAGPSSPPSELREEAREAMCTALARGRATLADVGIVDGTGGMIAVDAGGAVALAFTSDAMNRGLWREGSEPEAWV